MNHRRATVTAFDREMGLGELTDEHAAIWPFHCIAIADGTRSIDLGAQVTFDVLPKFGRWEATDIRRV